MDIFKNLKRASHTISESKTPRNIPSTSVRKPNVSRPVPLVSRCASCGGGRRK